MQADNAHNIYSAFEAVARRRAHHTAVIYLGTRFSYGGLEGNGRKLGRGLAGARASHRVSG